MKKKKAKIKIIIVHESHVTLEGIKAELLAEHGITIAGMARSSEELTFILSKNKVDVILISDQLPRRDEVIKKIREKDPAVKIMMLVSEYSEKANGRASRVDGIVLKDEGKKELIRAIKTIIEEGEYYPAEYREKVFRSERSNKKREDSEVKLSKQELIVLQCLNDDMSGKQIAQRLGISENTVKTHRKHLYEKLDVHTVTSLLNKARALDLIK